MLDSFLSLKCSIHVSPLFPLRRYLTQRLVVGDLMLGHNCVEVNMINLKEKVGILKRFTMSFLLGLPRRILIILLFQVFQQSILDITTPINIRRLYFLDNEPSHGHGENNACNNSLRGHSPIDVCRIIC